MLPSTLVAVFELIVDGCAANAPSFQYIAR